MNTLNHPGWPMAPDLSSQIAVWTAAERTADLAGLALAASLLPQLRLVTDPHPSAVADFPGGGEVRVYACAGQQFTFHLANVPAHAAQALVDEALEIGYFECLKTGDGEATESIEDAVPETYGQTRPGVSEDVLTVGGDGRCGLSLHRIDVADAAEALVALGRVWRDGPQSADRPAGAVQGLHRSHCLDCRHPCSPPTGACWTAAQHESARAARDAAEAVDEAA
ncbi:hypothetical protein, partial [Streptacidiphilus jiangxiensis]